MERFSVEFCVRGYHVFKHISIANVGEEQPCQRENGNPADPFAVAVESGVTYRERFLQFVDCSSAETAR